MGARFDLAWEELKKGNFRPPASVRGAPGTHQEL